jgi:PIN domain nuclease of toxin-antitoxin system
MSLPATPKELLTELYQRGYSPLTITHEHAAAVYDLPLIHKDPFDRLLVAQRMVEGLTLVTADAALAAYDVPICW